MINVTTWQQLITALTDETDDITWDGDAAINHIDLPVTKRWNGTANIVIQWRANRVLDFNGLTIDLITTSAPAEGRDFQPSAAESTQAQLWCYGFPAVKGSITIKNLTVNKIELDHPRDILIRGTVTMQNVYCYDISCDSIESNSKWLDNAGRLHKGKYRACSDFIIGSGAFTRMDGYQYQRNSSVIANGCIFKINTKNAGIFFAGGAYYACELEYNYTFDWTLADKASNWDLLSIFPAGYMKVYDCNITGKITIDSDWQLLAAERRDAGANASPAYHSFAVFASVHSIFNFETEIKDDNFEGLIVENDMRVDVTTGGYCYSNFLLTGGVNYETTSSYNTSSAIWVTNNGDQVWGDVDIEMQQLLGDLRNIDLMHDRNIPCIKDEGFRNPQYNTVPYDWHDPTDPSSNPNWARRINPNVYDGIPFLPMWFYPYVVPPEPKGDPEYNYICIFDMKTEQNEFDTNGICILEPTQCRVTEELNGGWNLTLVHPKDSFGKWRYIMEMNIIKCLGQLFIIRKVIIKNTANSQSVTAYAEHITYHLNDYWLFPGTSIAGYHGQTLIDSILEQMWDVGEEGQTRYAFDIKTDLNSDPTFKEWYEMKEGHTPYEMILGSNGFTSLIGGELYRDNFTVKITSRMYGAQDDAFVLHPDLNLKSVEKTVDLQTFCTYFRGYDDRGGWFAIAWNPATMPRAYPHNVVRSQNFTFDVADEYYDFQMLVRKTQEFFGRYCAPLISFRISIQDLKHHPEYKEFINNYRFKVGDIGKVWDAETNRYYSLEITKTVKDGITGECIEVVIGDERSFTRPHGYPITVDKNYDWNIIDEYDPANPPEAPYTPTTVEDYLYETDNSEITLILYLGTSTRVLVPDKDSNDIPVTKIAASCFDGSFSLEAVTVPEGIEVIE